MKRPKLNNEITGTEIDRLRKAVIEKYRQLTGNGNKGTKSKSEIMDVPEKYSKNIENPFYTDLNASIEDELRKFKTQKKEHTKSERVYVKYLSNQVLAKFFTKDNPAFKSDTLESLYIYAYGQERKSYIKNNLTEFLQLYSFNNKEYIDRKEYTEKIQKAFNASNIVQIHGQGGIGKTSILKSYINTVQSDGVNVFYFEIVDNLKTDIIKNLSIVYDYTHTDSADANFSKLTKAITEYKDILIIIDRLDQNDDNRETSTLIEIYEQIVKPTAGKIKVLISGRYELTISNYTEFITTIRIDLLNEKEGINFVQKFISDDIINGKTLSEVESLSNILLKKAYYIPVFLKMLIQSINEKKIDLDHDFLSSNLIEVAGNLTNITNKPDKDSLHKETLHDILNNIYRIDSLPKQDKQVVLCLALLAPGMEESIIIDSFLSGSRLGKFNKTINVLVKSSLLIRQESYIGSSAFMKTKIGIHEFTRDILRWYLPHQTLDTIINTTQTFINNVYKCNYKANDITLTSTYLRHNDSIIDFYVPIIQKIINKPSDEIIKLLFIRDLILHHAYACFHMSDRRKSIKFTYLLIQMQVNVIISPEITGNDESVKNELSKLREYWQLLGYNFWHEGKPEYLLKISKQIVLPLIHQVAEDNEDLLIQTYNDIALACIKLSENETFEVRKSEYENSAVHWILQSYTICQKNILKYNLEAIYGLTLQYLISIFLKTNRLSDINTNEYHKKYLQTIKSLSRNPTSELVLAYLTMADVCHANKEFEEAGEYKLTALKVRQSIDGDKELLIRDSLGVIDYLLTFNNKNTEIPKSILDDIQKKYRTLVYRNLDTKREFDMKIQSLLARMRTDY